MSQRSLRSRISVVFAAVSVASAVVLLATPATVSSPVHWREIVIVLVGLSAVLVLTLLLLRHALAPLERLTTLMRQVELLSPGNRIPVYGAAPEIVHLTRSFNDMLERLEEERHSSIRRSLEAQESERLRIARELHDEVGQSLTAVLLHLDRVSRLVPAEVQPQVAEARDTARASLNDVRAIARRLRPEALDDLGLPSALSALVDRLSEQTGTPVDCRVDRDLPDLTPDAELVVYRVAQEALTNALRHARATRIEVRLEGRGSQRAALLTVTDDGRGIDERPPGAGIQGMRERALLVDASLRVGPRLGAGTMVTLRIPEEASAT